MTLEEISEAQQSRWLRTARKLMGISVAELAGLLKVSTRTINAWENEKSSCLPSREKFITYLVILTDGKALPSPDTLVSSFLEPRNTSSNHFLQSNENLATLKKFFQLNRENRASVEFLVHSLNKAQRLMELRKLKNSTSSAKDELNQELE